MLRESLVVCCGGWVVDVLLSCSMKCGCEQVAGWRNGKEDGLWLLGVCSWSGHCCSV